MLKLSHKEKINDITEAIDQGNFWLTMAVAIHKFI